MFGFLRLWGFCPRAYATKFLYKIADETERGSPQSRVALAHKKTGQRCSSTDDLNETRKHVVFSPLRIIHSCKGVIF